MSQPTEKQTILILKAVIETQNKLLAIAFFATPLGDFYADPFKSKPVGETK